ncbi:MAG: leucine-rich repeat protein [Bacteroides sp.]|nr:leucine-rich repeat protein [Bacteroides sp.]
MKQKLLLILIALAVMLPITALADSFTYTYQGQTLNYYSSGSTCNVRADPSITGAVVIPEVAVDDSGKSYKVTSIGELAFYGCSDLTSVTIPNSVTEIGTSAFWGCSGLTSVTIPNSVTEIGWSTFYGCSSLTSITIPNSVTEIGISAFRDCSGLTSITIPNSVTEIGDGAFNGCSGIKELTIEDNTETLWVGNNNVTKGLFSDCPLETLYLGRNLSNGSDYTPFRDITALKSVTIGNSVTEIGYHAFYGCSGLTSIIIPNSVTEIGQYAFCGCTDLTSVTIPNSVTEIGQYAFCGCKGLTSINIPISVLSIAAGAYEGCTRLNSISIGNSVTTIGIDAFKNCLSIKDITVFAYNPPQVSPPNFPGDVYKNAILRVPDDNIKAYKTAAVWSSFNKIIGISEVDAKIEFELNKGTTAKLNLITTPENTTNETVTWSTSDSEVAIVNNDGLVAAIKEGAAIITATYNGVKASSAISVVARNSTTEFILNINKAEILENELLQLSVLSTPENLNDKDIVWISTDTKVATVDATGKISGIKEGNAVIVAVTSNGLTASCTVTVVAKTIEATGLKLNIESSEIVEAQTLQLTATISPDEVTEKSVTWSSSDSSVASVDASGKVTAIKAGTATITATTSNGLTASCTVTVKAKSAGIDEVDSEGESAVRVDGGNIIAPEGSEVFDLNGRRVAACGLRPGIYIVRIPGGKAVKIRVK